MKTDQFTALPEDPPTPLWELILEQFKDQLVIILLGSAAVSFVLAVFEGGDDWTAFVDPVVVCLPEAAAQIGTSANNLLLCRFSPS
jgi:magnesium-transporting ATPase (P-type)